MVTGPQMLVFILFPCPLHSPAPIQIKKAGDKDIDDIKTLMEEVDMRIAETKKV